MTEKQNKYICNHCGQKFKKTGGSANESGMIEMYYYGFPERKEKQSVYYCYECAVEIAKEILDEVL